jgi:hypothetical protein
MFLLGMSNIPIFFCDGPIKVTHYTPNPSQFNKLIEQGQYIFKMFFTFIFCLYPNLAKPSYGSFPLMLTSQNRKEIKN